MTSSVFVPRPAEGLNFPNVLQMFAARLAKTPDLPALRHKQAGAWRATTWRGWNAASRELAAALIHHGVKRGDRVAIMSATRMEWVLCDLAIAMAGAVSVPIYPSVTAEQATYILENSGSVVAVVERSAHVRAILNPEFTNRIAKLRHIVHLDSEVDSRGERVAVQDLHGQAPSCELWETFRACGASNVESATPLLAAIAAELGLDHEMTYVYTSGTTGIPKGVVLTHKNLVYESWAIKNVIPVDHTDEQLMVLPLAHIFARHLVWGSVEQGSVVAFAERLDQVAENLKEIAPTYMGAVPRIYEKVYDKILDGVSRTSIVKKSLFAWCLDVGRKVSVCKQRGQIVPSGLTLKLLVADRLVFSKIRAIFGGRLRFFVSGGAPLRKDIAEFFHAAGVLILEGYGLSETTGATNVNRPDRYRFGTVGPAMPGCEIRIAEDGEVLVRSHNVFARYHDLPQETTEVLDKHGWFHTGDIGELKDGFLRITDRKKDLIKTAGGKYIAPQMLENQLKGHPGISHAMVIGDNRPYAVALITIDEAAMMAISQQEGLGCKSYADLVRHPRVKQLVQKYVDEVNATLAPFESLKRFEVLPADFTEATGELTPTLKVKRKVVAEKYAELVAQMYAIGSAASPAGHAKAASSV